VAACGRCEMLVIQAGCAGKLQSHDVTPVTKPPRLQNG
jgi:hypothetical protein